MSLQAHYIRKTSSTSTVGQISAGDSCLKAHVLKSLASQYTFLSLYGFKKNNKKVFKKRSESVPQCLHTICLSLQKRPVEDSDWRKNVEAMSGMEGRKKMFDAAKGSVQ